MVFPSFSAEKREGEGCAVVEFVQEVVDVAMRCFIGCFRSRDSHSCVGSAPREPSVSYNKKALSSLFLSDDDSRRTDRECLNSLPADLDIKELETQAKFLKACGTLVNTPVEIRKASRKWVDASTLYEETSGFISNSPTEKHSDGSLSVGSPTHVRTCKEWVGWEDFSVRTPARNSTSCRSDELSTVAESIKSTQSSDAQNNITSMDVVNEETCSLISPVSPEVTAKSGPGKYKSVRFECESDNSTCSSGSSDQCSKKPFSAYHHSSLKKASPDPTPIKLHDDMQTPGTVFPAYMDNMTGGKAGKIRSQYVFSVWNPVHCPLQEKEFKDDDYSDSSNGRKSFEPNHAVDLTSTLVPEMSAKDSFLWKDAEDREFSFSPWLKSESANQDYTDEQCDSSIGDHIHGATPMDRPIVGMVASHWNDSATSQKFLDCRAGNGIPNTNNKYKEDKRVSWHATPFEERLEKALSKEAFISQRHAELQI
ncbi:protein JASON-like [Andrographis paniculata]|uniref:protein JASON-like n=1 Tax=Andrographis paniculata TaxID=175694 RepID=UPI0021E73046|nr:protein JASON-like [Andrographis paniculata]